MSLNPPLSVAQALKESISSTLQAAIPASIRAATIAPQLAIINQWIDQIPLLLDSPDAINANFLFALRKDLFIGPQFVQCVLGIPVSELPSAFQNFLSLIFKVIEAQKSDRDKPVSKVRLCSLF